MVLMVLFVLLLFSMTFYYLTTSQIIQTSHQEEVNRVRIGAESSAASALHEYRNDAQGRLASFITQWNMNNPNQPLFRCPVTHTNAFVNNYIEILKAVSGLNDPLNSTRRFSKGQFDQRSITDLDAFIVLGNAPITVTGYGGAPSTVSQIESAWPLSDYSNWGIRGNVTYTDTLNFAVKVEIPYRILTMAGTEISGGSYSSQYNILEEGLLVQNFERYGFNLETVYTEIHRNRLTPGQEDNWGDGAIWFTGNTHFRGTVRTNDHFQIINHNGRPVFYDMLISANAHHFNSDWQSKIPQGYMPWGASSGQAYSSVLNDLFNNKMHLFNTHHPIVLGNPPGYENRPVAYSNPVEFPENTVEQRIKSLNTSAIDWDSSWNDFSGQTVINTDSSGNVTGGIYVGGDADYVRFSVVNAHNNISSIAPWRDADNNPLPVPAIHSNNHVNNLARLDNGFQKIEIKQGSNITQILVQDDNFIDEHGTVHNVQRTYVRSRPGSGNWNNVRWNVYDNIPNGMLYVDGNIKGPNISRGSGTGLSGVISGNLKPRRTTQGELVYTSDSTWNVTARGDIYLEGNVLYSYYGCPDAVYNYNDPDESKGFNNTSQAGIYRYGHHKDQHDFYDFNSSLFAVGADGEPLFQNMLGIFTADGDIFINPNNMTGTLRHFFLDAFVMASGHGKMIEVYDYQNWASPVGQGPVRLRGGYIEYLYGAHGTFNSSNNTRAGFGRNFSWDRRAPHLHIPFWPSDNSYADVINAPLTENIRRKPVSQSVSSWPPSITELYNMLDDIFENIL